MNTVRSIFIGALLLTWDHCGAHYVEPIDRLKWPVWQLAQEAEARLTAAQFYETRLPESWKLQSIGA